jgi:hypothetical protein
MATIAIEVTLDEHGVVQGVQNIEGALTKAGQKGNLVFTAMEQNVRKAHDATSLFSRTLGVELPRTLEKVIAQSSLIGPLMSAAFSATVVLALGAALVAIIPKIQDAASSIGGFGEALRQSYADAVKLNNQLLITFSSTRIGRFLLDMTHAQQAANDAQIAQLEAIQAMQGEDVAGLAVRTVLSYKLLALQKEHTELADRERDQIKQLGVTQKEDREAEAAASKKAQQDAAAENAARQKTLDLLFHRTKEAHDDLMKALGEESDQLEKINDLDVKNFIAANDAQIKANEDRITGLNQIVAAENEANAARLESVGDTMGAMLMREKFRVDQALEGLQRLGLGEADLQAARDALNAQTNAKIVQENRTMVNTLADQLVSIWDDIASGNIGKTILNLFKKLIAQMIAQWLLGIGVMRNAFAGGQQSGTGILGGLFGSLFGMGSGSSGGGGFNLGGLLGLGGSASSASGGVDAGFVGFGPGISGPAGGDGMAPLSAGTGTAGLAASQASGGGFLNSLLGGIFGKGSVNFLGKSMSASALGGQGLMLGISGIASGLAGGGVLGSGTAGRARRDHDGLRARRAARRGRGRRDSSSRR